MSQTFADNLLPASSGYDLGLSPSQEWDVKAQTLSVSGTSTLTGAVTLGGALSGITTVSMSGQLTSTLAGGTPPLVVASNTKVVNLNADLLDGNDWTAPGTIGGSTPGAASFTTISATGVITSSLGTGTAPLSIASTTKVANLNADLLDGADWASPSALGSTAPAAVTGTTVTGNTSVTVGSSGTALTQYKLYSQSLAPASVAANTSAEQTFTVTGLTSADKVWVNKPTSQAGLGIVGVRVSASDTLAITYGNFTASPIVPTTETYNIVAVRS